MKTLKTQPLSDISQTLIERSQRELSEPEKPVSRSRVWSSPAGYRYLVKWSNLVLLRHFVVMFTNSKYAREYKKKAQLDDAARSAVRNLEEGFKRATTSEYLDSIGYSQGSLEEVKGDIRDATDDGFLESAAGSSLAGIGINLGEFSKALRPDAKGSYRNLKEFKGEGGGNGGYRNLEESTGEENAGKGGYRNIQEVKGKDKVDQPLNSFKSPLESSNPPLKSFRDSPYSSMKKPPESDSVFLYNPLTVLYPPLKQIKADDLTYEIFIELINKTDFLLRKLVESLEKKLSHDQKYYKVEQARIRYKFKKR